MRIFFFFFYNFHFISKWIVNEMVSEQMGCGVSYILIVPKALYYGHSLSHVMSVSFNVHRVVLFSQALS